MTGYLRFLQKLWPVIVYAGFLDLATFALALHFHQKTSSMPVTMLVIVIFVLNPLILPNPEMYDPKFSPEDEQLSEKVKAMAAKLDVDPMPVRVLTGPKGSEIVNAYIQDGSIFITQKAVQSMSEREVDFMLGHEVGHLRKLREKQDRAKPVSKWLIIPILVLFTVAVVIGRIEFPWQYRVGAVAPLILAMAPMVYIQSKNPANSKETELWCDKTGAELCGDLEAAKTAIATFTVKQSKFDAKLSGYPTREERLAQIDQMIVAR